MDIRLPLTIDGCNDSASAVFCNVPPTLVRDDQLHNRLGYGYESISKLMNKAIGKIMEELSNSEVHGTDGRLIASQAENKAWVIIVANPDEEKEINPVLIIRKNSPSQQLLSCDRPYKVLEESDSQLRLRIRLAKEDSAVAVLG